MRLRLLVLGFSLAWPLAARAACPDDDYVTTICLYGETGTCRQSCDLSGAKVQATIDASAEGDGVYLPSGSATWDSQVDFDKAVTYMGAGRENTLITVGSGTCSTLSTTNACVYVTADNADIGFIGWRIGNSGPQAILTAGVTGLKIHDCDFRRTVAYTSGHTHHVQHLGDARGVIFSNTFYGGGVGFDGSNDPPWAAATGWGGPDFLYIEGNVFSDANAYTTVPLSSGMRTLYGNAGAKVVFRYNSVLAEDSRIGHDNPIDAHGYCHGPHVRSTRAYEIYNNLMQSSPGTMTSRFFFLRGGTGLVYNNMLDKSQGAPSGSDIELRDYRSADDLSVGTNGYGDACSPGTGVENAIRALCLPTYYGVRVSWSPLTSQVDKLLGGETSGTEAAVWALRAGTPTAIEFMSYGGTGFLSGENLLVDGVAAGTATQDQETFNGEGYPCADQIGRGQNNTAEPYFFWGNVDQDLAAVVAVASAGQIAGYITEGVDFCNHDTSTSCGGITVTPAAARCPLEATGLSGTCDAGLHGVSGYNVEGGRAPAAPANLRAS